MSPKIDSGKCFQRTRYMIYFSTGKTCKGDYSHAHNKNVKKEIEINIF